MTKQLVPFYDALPTDADRVRVNAAIMFSMKQDVGFCQTFLKAVADEESRLNQEYQKKDNPPLVRWTDKHSQNSRQDAFQNVLDGLRSKLSQNIDALPAVQPNGYEKDIDGKPSPLNLEAQRAIFRSVRDVKDPKQFLEQIANAEVKKVGQRTLEGTGYTRPLIELENQAPNSDAAIAFKQQMRREMSMVAAAQTGAALGESGVSAAGAAPAATHNAKPPAQAASR